MVAAEGGPTCSCPASSTNSFNGAAAWWPRKDAVAIGAAVDTFSLQWGRGLVAAEGGPQVQRGPGCGVASMGPRLGGRGRGVSLIVGISPDDASMGPRLGGRGRRATQVNTCSAGVASMGPRLGGRGRTGNRIGVAGNAFRFNGAAAWWPRKGPGPMLDARSGHELQWGRGLVAAEGLREIGGTPHPYGFNGAAAWWPRKVCWESSWSSSSSSLQWGRGLVAAEGRAIAPMKLPAMPLQWGRGLVAAEGGTRGGSSCASRTRFNGAAAWWPRKAAHLGDDARRRIASLGPRLGGRGRSLARFDPVSCSWLQWGRGLVAAEGARAPVVLDHVDARASMGPRLGGRGRPQASSQRAGS